MKLIILIDTNSVIVIRLLLLIFTYIDCNILQQLMKTDRAIFDLFRLFLITINIVTLTTSIYFA